MHAIGKYTCSGKKGGFFPLGMGPKSPPPPPPGMADKALHTDNMSSDFQNKFSVIKSEYPTARTLRSGPIFCQA